MKTPHDRNKEKQLSQRAVVIGAGIAGLLAAAALSRAVPQAQVILLDRDAVPDGPENRRGVPQGRHAHLLMAGGWSAMELLFTKSVRERLFEAGAHEISMSNGMLALAPDAGWFRRYRRNGSGMITCTRSLLDWVVRESLMDDTTNVSIHQAAVDGLKPVPTLFPAVSVSISRLVGTNRHAFRRGGEFRHKEKTSD